jgi:hypothetical protein
MPPKIIIGSLVRMAGNGWDASPIGVVVDEDEILQWRPDSLVKMRVLWANGYLEDVSKKWLEIV